MTNRTEIIPRKARSAGACLALLVPCSCVACDFTWRPVERERPAVQSPIDPQCVLARGENGFVLTGQHVSALRALLSPPPHHAEAVDIALSVHLYGREQGMDYSASTRELLVSYRKALQQKDPRELEQELKRIREKLRVRKTGNCGV